MMDAIKLPFVFDSDKLQQTIGQLENTAWLAHFVQQNYQGSWEIIALRGPTGETHPIRQAYSDPGHTEFSDTPILNELTYLKTVLAHFETELYSTRLMKLSAGSKIKEHTDYKLSLDDECVRLHIPIITHPKVCFFLNGNLIKMRAGECWYLNFNLPHSVDNKSHIDRIHLVVDMKVNAWLRENIPTDTIQVKSS